LYRVQNERIELK